MTTTPIALGERAMLVNLSVSIWSARKHDIRISDKVAAEHGADRSMGRYAKHLIPRELLTAVNAANSALRDHHNLNTLAWGDDGTRILPAANYLGYQAHQQTLEDKFGRAVPAVLNAAESHCRPVVCLRRGMVVSPDCHSVGETARGARFGVSKRVPSTIRKAGEPPGNPARRLAPVLRDLPRPAPREQRDLPDR